MRAKCEEPAEKLLKRTPTAEMKMEREGFLGALYRPDADRYPGKALVMVGGSDGLFSLKKLVAETYAERGLTVLALPYWNQEELPRALSHIPLELGERAGQWLRQQGYRKIGIWGISMGAVFALLCGCYLPELYSCVVAVSPLSVCPQGIQKKNRWFRKMGLLEGSAFCFRGEDCPWTPLRFSKGKILLESLTKRELTLRSCYAGAVEQAPEKARLPVERINGAVLLAAAEQDSMWPSRESAEEMVRRLSRHGFCHPVGYLHYPVASHLLLPCQLKSRRIFRLERSCPERCAESNRDAFEKTLDFLRENW